MQAIEVLAQQEKDRVQELYITALAYVTIAFIEADETRKKEMLPMVSALLNEFEKNPVGTGINIHAAGFFAGAVIFGVAVGSPVVLPVISCVSVALGAANFYQNNLKKR